MAYDYSDLSARAQQWLNQAQAEGWLGKHTTLPTTEAAPPFLAGGSDNRARPLMVAFMGGTGVGKSSLLNRLAGKAIAKAGVERPTSREITLYRHQNLQLSPSYLPLTGTRIADHDDARYRHIVWIDMPDFDSVATGNHALVRQWLPYIDVLLYVVSPERYRDGKAWRMLLAEGAKHAWLFVFNQWDMGQAAQFDDFRQQLHGAGFEQPLIFKTICGDANDSDDFAELQTTLAKLANEQAIRQLEQRGLQVRKLALRQALEPCRNMLGNDAGWKQLPNDWRQQWKKTRDLLQQGFVWPMQQIAKHYAEHSVDLISHPLTDTVLWDPWAQARFDDALDELAISADQRGLPAAPLKKQLSPLRGKAGKHLLNQTEAATRQALAKPGTAWQRGLLKLLHLGEMALPLAAMAWVSHQVFIGYYTSNQTNSHYLGADFAIHSGLLIALTWLIPFFILQKFQPSLQKSALRGLKKGVANALEQIDSEVLAALDALDQQRQHHHQALEQIIIDCACEVPPESVIGKDDTLQRMLADHTPAPKQ